MENKQDLKKRLTPIQYEVTQNKGTEPPFTGKYWKTMDKGKYLCIVCSQELFKSDDKFVSECGWPAFSLPISSTVVKEETDTSYGIIRTEVLCSKCGAHLGHVFEDGPKSSGGLRYCINSASINFLK